ncbi:MAG: outer membrane beta-barrel protein [Burkholderiales bacterium]|jgi:outer membrane protein|nr:outer membrane beta-barrel protein [Burkholderiales bacterium]
MKVLVSAVSIAVALAITGTAQAQNTDSKLVVKVGIANVVPKSDNGTLLGGALNTDIGSSARPSITLEYMVTPNIGVELLGAWPFRNEIKLNGVEHASVDVLPPTLSVQYHFLPDKAVSPFVGVGLNYAFIYNEKEKASIAGAKLEIDDSWGVAAHFGVDINFNKNWVATIDGRWINMDSDVKLNGIDIGKAHIDPWVWGASIGYRF